MPYTVTSTDKPNDTYTFTYDGVKWTGTVPAGAISLKVYLWGGGGGGGAQETSGSDGYGAAGHYATHEVIDLTSYVGETITIGVGGGGAGGSNTVGVLRVEPTVEVYQDFQAEKVVLQDPTDLQDLGVEEAEPHLSK